MDLAVIALQGGPWGLVGLFVLSVMRGWLVPGRIHDEVRADRDAYKKAAETSLKASTETAGQLRRMTSAVGQLATAVEQQSATTRETLALVRALTTGERAA